MHYGWTDVGWRETETAFFSFSNEVEGTTTRRKRERERRNSSGGGGGGGGGNSNCSIYRYAAQLAERAPVASLGELDENVKFSAKKREGEKVKTKETELTKVWTSSKACVCVGGKVTTEGGRK